MKKSFFTPLILVTFLCVTSQAQLNQNGQTFRNSVQPQSTSATDNNYLERIGEWPYGPSFSVAVDSIRDIIFLGSGGGLFIIDGTDKTNPHLITDTIRTTGLVKDIFYDASKERLYLACGEGGYEIWNVEDPPTPFLYSRNEIYYYDVETPVGHVQVTGDYAIFECAWGYIHSVNVSDPYNPYQVSINGFVGNPAHNIHIDQYGHIHATGQQEYVILYLNTSGQLYTAGELPIYNCNAVFGGSQASYVGQGDYLYIIYNGGSSSTNVGGLTHIEVRGYLAYIINDSGLNIWDVSDNNNPFLLANASTESYPYDLYVAGDYAYISAGSYGLNIMDIKNPSTPVLVGSFDTYASTYENRVKDNIAYVAHSSDGLLMIDISDLEYPELIGQFQTSSYNFDIELKDTLAYLACWEAGFKIVNVSDPENPVGVSGIDNFNASKLELGENYVYVVETYPPNTSYNIKVINITDPGNPFAAGSISFMGLVNELAYYNDYLFIADYNSGLRILNITDPQNPFEVITIPLQQARDVYIKNNLLYLSFSNHGLHVFDITDPELPIEVIYYESGAFFDVAVADSFWYASDGDDIWLFYLTNSYPVYLDRYRLPDLTFDMFPAGKYLYVSNQAAGLSIYKNTLIEEPPVSNWEFQTSGITQDIWAVKFISLTEGWAAADDGLLLHTTDGGEHWTIIGVGGSSDNFRDITFVNENIGWVCGENSAMYKTDNGGQNWFQLNVPTTSVIRSIYFLNESTGWAVTLEDHLILKTTDGGETWAEQNSGLSGNLHNVKVFFTDENNGFVLGFILTSPQFENYILKTTDGGQTWTTNFDFQYNSMASIYFINHDVGWIGGNNGFLIKTTDAGETWLTQNSGTDEFITAISFTDENKGWYTGFEGTLFQSNDGGNSWLRNEVLIQNDLRGVYFVDKSNGWVVGSNGIILHYQESATNTYSVNSIVPKQFILSQNYPNPFNSGTTILFSIPYNDIFVSLKVYNLLGEEVATLVDQLLPAGNHQINFEATGLTSGIYFYRLSAGRLTETKKMILLR